MVYLNVCIVYLNVFECTYNKFVVYFNVSIIYFNAFKVCFNVFQCIYRHCNWISPSHSHCNVFAMHTHIHIYFSLYTMTPFPTCYTLKTPPGLKRNQVQGKCTQARGATGQGAENKAHRAKGHAKACPPSPSCQSPPRSYMWCTVASTNPIAIPLHFFFSKPIDPFQLSYTPSVPNYLSVLIGTQILRNLWEICENAQLGSNSSLNKLSNELFYTQNGVVNKKIRWFDQGCNLVFIFSF
jgi:hypothetical protein